MLLHTKTDLLQTIDLLLYKSILDVLILAMRITFTSGQKKTKTIRFISLSEKTKMIKKPKSFIF